MDVSINDISCIRIKLNNDELQDLVQGERLVVDLDAALQIEIYHSADLKYPPRKQYLNGEEQHDN